jgi:hypothetical protein
VPAHWNKSADRHVAPIGQIILIPSQPVFALSGVQTHKVLVDKAVCRFKKFQIVSQVIPQSLSSSSDKIFQVTAFLTNFLPPISLDIS